MVLLQVMVAEGTFIVKHSSLLTTTFIYYAKAKVGPSAGTTLHTFLYNT